MSVTFLFLLSLIATLVSVRGTKTTFHLPGVHPQTYQQYEPVKLFVSKLTSTKTQIPYDYYSLPYCKPAKFDFQVENLGEILSGDVIEASVYKLEAKVPKSCEVACALKMKPSDKNAFIRAIDDEYSVHWIVDNLPVGMTTTNELRETVFARGFPVGFHTGKKGNMKHYLNNHVRIIIQYHDDNEDIPDSPVKVGRI